MSQTIIGALLALIGLGGVIQSLIDLVRARRSHEWALVDAEIVESQVENKKGSAHGGSWFVPVVRYRYSWNGEHLLMDFTIRQADFTNPEDCAGVVDVLNSYASDQIGGGQPLTREVRERLPVGLREHPTTLVFLAFVEGRPVGVAVCFLGFSTFQARPLLNIHDLAVVPDWRGQGIGRALLEAVEAEAIQRGCCKITLEVQDANRQARGLYERYGFADFVIGDSPTRFLCKLLASRA